MIKSNCSGDGNYTLLLHDKSSINLEEKENEIKDTWFDRRYLHTNSFFKAYYPITPCVLIEEMVSESETGAEEYKFLCFRGIPTYIYYSNKHFVMGNAVHDFPISFFDTNWNNLGIVYGNHTNDAAARNPKFMREMLEISRVLSEDFSFVRVDFFETDSRFYLSEMTFAQGAGLTPYYPDSFDFELGKLWVM